MNNDSLGKLISLSSRKIDFVLGLPQAMNFVYCSRFVMTNTLSSVSKLISGVVLPCGIVISYKWVFNINPSNKPIFVQKTSLYLINRRFEQSICYPIGIIILHRIQLVVLHRIQLVVHHRIQFLHHILARQEVAVQNRFL